MEDILKRIQTIDKRGTYNPHFSLYQKRIEEALIRNHKENYEEFANYTITPDEKILQACQQHAQEYTNQKQQNTKNTLIFVHPFYLPLSKSNWLLYPELKEDWNKITKSFTTLLQQNKKEKFANTILVETAHHYASLSSLLVEEGYIDKVLFTKFDSGDCLQQRAFENINNKNIFFSGGFVRNCLKNVLYQVQLQSKNSTIFGIKENLIDLIDLSLPNKKYTLHPGRSAQGFSFFNIYSTNQTIEHCKEHNNKK